MFLAGMEAKAVTEEMVETDNRGDKADKVAFVFIPREMEVTAVTEVQADPVEGVPAVLPMVFTDLGLIVFSKKIPTFNPELEAQRDRKAFPVLLQDMTGPLGFLLLRAVP